MTRVSVVVLALYSSSAPCVLILIPSSGTETWVGMDRQNQHVSSVWHGITGAKKTTKLRSLYVTAVEWKTAQILNKQKERPSFLNFLNTNQADDTNDTRDKLLRRILTKDILFQALLLSQILRP